MCAHTSVYVCVCVRAGVLHAHPTHLLLVSMRTRKHRIIPYGAVRCDTVHFKATWLWRMQRVVLRCCAGRCDATRCYKTPKCKYVVIGENPLRGFTVRVAPICCKFQKNNKHKNNVEYKKTYKEIQQKHTESGLHILKMSLSPAPFSRAGRSPLRAWVRSSARGSSCFKTNHHGTV